MTISRGKLRNFALNIIFVMVGVLIPQFFGFKTNIVIAADPQVIIVTTTIQAAIDISSNGDTINVPADYASTTEVYPIDFFGHENITFDCQNSGALIGPNSIGNAQINMTTGTTITNCTFKNIEIVSWLNLNFASDIAITNNTFSNLAETSTIMVSGGGSVNISGNERINYIDVSGFSGGTINSNTIWHGIISNLSGIHVEVPNKPSGSFTINSNEIRVYDYSVSPISITGWGGDINVLVDRNLIKYPTFYELAGFNYGPFSIFGSANVIISNNFIDGNLLKLHSGNMVFIQADPSYYGSEPSNITFTHNTFVFNNDGSGSGPNTIYVESVMDQGYNVNITSTYNIWANMGTTSLGTYGIVLNTNTSTFSGRIYSSYDGFWNFASNTLDLDFDDNNEVTTNNVFAFYPFFETGDDNLGNDLYPAPFSNYLDVGGPEGPDADVGAYSSIRRNSIRVAAYANSEDIDYNDIDVTSTAHIGDALRTGGTIYLLGNGSYGEDLYGPIIISSSSLCTSSISIRGGFSGSSIDATGFTSGISLIGINSATIEDIDIYDSSGPAIKLVNSSGNYLYKVYGIRSDYGIWFSDNSQNNSIVSSRFYDNILYDIYSSSDYDNTLTFTRFHPASSSIVSVGNIDVYNNFYLVSENSIGDTLGGVDISILDNNGGQSFTTTTNDGGYIYERPSFLAWIMTSSSPTSTTSGGYNPFTIIASKAGYITTSSIINLIDPDTEAYLKIWEITPTSSSDIATSLVNTSSIKISWTDNSDNEDGFVIEKSTTSTSGFVFAATSSIDATSTIINSLLPNTQYWFRVAAFNLDSTSTYATTTEGTYTLATDPSSVSAVANSATQITVSWADDDSSAYYVSRTGNNSGWITSTSHIFSGLTCGTSYTFNVKAKNHDDIETGSVAVTASTGNCSSGGGGGGGGTAAAPISSVSAIDVPLVINGTQEGTISYNSGNNDSVQVMIPKNSFTGTATFKVVNSTLAGNDPVGGSAINGGVYVITATDSNNNHLTSFSNNITITFSGLVLPTDLSNVGVYYLNETTNEWVLINGSVFDQAAGKVTFSVNHFTKFAVLNVSGTPSVVKNSVNKITAIDGTIIEGKLKIKVSGKSAIYWLDQNNSYYYYPDGDVFKSWNVDESYNYYKAVSQTSFNSLSQPSVAPYHVFYRNGSEVVKYLSSDKLYVVGLNNVLYPITNEAVVSLYGSKYKAKTIGLSEWPYYVKDTTTTVDVNSVYPGMFIKIAGKNYFIDNERKMREIAADAMRPNHLKPAYFRTLTANAVTGLEVGEIITNKVSELTSFVGY